MFTDSAYRSPLPPTSGAGPTPDERVDLEDPEALRRAVALHRAGHAVFAIPFGSAGDGTLTWLDPRARSTRQG